MHWWQTGKCSRLQSGISRVRFPNSAPIYMADPIESDDEKMEELLTLQSMTEVPEEPSSLEEKYEEQLIMEQVLEIVDKQLSQRQFIDEEDEAEMEERSKRP